jgi:predicted histidine transporter YuiF (NhaC family)
MTTIKTLIYIEDILLNADNDFRYKYSLDELIKSETYIKEIGLITGLFFSVQMEYGKVNDTKDEEYKQKLVDYHNKLISDELDVDITKYIEFIKKILPRLTDEKYKKKLESITEVTQIQFSLPS